MINPHQWYLNGLIKNAFVNTVASGGLMGYAENLLMPSVIPIRNEIGIAAIQTYSEVLLAPTVVIVNGTNVVTVANVLSYVTTVIQINFVGGAFKTTWKTDNLSSGSSANNQIRIPLYQIFGTIIIDWGDGNFDEVLTYNASNLLHTYASVGTYVVQISGRLAKLRMLDGDEEKIIDINFWGDIPFDTNHSSAFQNCIKIVSLPSVTPTAINGIITGGSMFSNCRLTELPESFTLPLLESGNNMFSSNLLTSLPTNMALPNMWQGSGMFSNNNLASLPSGMTLPALTHGSSMFFNNSSLTTLPPDMTLSLLQFGGGMFQNSNLTSLPTGMTLVALVSGYYMFSSTALTDLPSGMTLSALNAANTSEAMFSNVQINRDRYTQLIIDLESLNPSNNVTFGGGLSYYSQAGVAAHDILTGGTRNWTITDGGYLPNDVSSTLSKLSYIENIYGVTVSAIVSPIRPDADDATELWVVPPLWSKVNNGSDATSISSTQTTNTAIISLGPIPFTTSGNSVLFVRASKPTGGSDPSLTIEFRNGTTVLHSLTYSIAEGIWNYEVPVSTVLTSGGNYNVTLSSSTGGNPANRRESIVYDIWLTL